mgnify:CR=1 FL=1
MAPDSYCIYWCEVTNSAALFHCQANWDAPGRWGVEILTCKHRYIFRPLEKLHILKHNTVTVEYVDIDDQIGRASCRERV